VTAFRPISEAARSWSDDKGKMSQIMSNNVSEFQQIYKKH